MRRATPVLVLLFMLIASGFTGAIDLGSEGNTTDDVPFETVTSEVDLEEYRIPLLFDGLRTNA